MKKKSITYADLSKKQLQYLKDLFVQKKVESMSHEELKDFVQEIISHQVNDTIGHEEEMEAWREISNLYGDQLEKIIHEVQQKYPKNESLQNFEEDTQERRIELLEKNTIEKEKKDMWDD